MTALVAHRPAEKIRPIDVRPLRAVSDRPALDIPELRQPEVRPVPELRVVARPAAPAPRREAAAEHVGGLMLAARVTAAGLAGVVAAYGLQLWLML